MLKELSDITRAHVVHKALHLSFQFLQHLQHSHLHKNEFLFNVICDMFYQRHQPDAAGVLTF